MEGAGNKVIFRYTSCSVTKPFLRVPIFRTHLYLFCRKPDHLLAIMAVYPKSHTHAQCNKPEKTNDFATKEAQADILLG